MKKITIVASYLICLLMLCGCRQKDDNRQYAEIRNVVSSSVKVARSYYDSLLVVPDSDINRLMKDFDDKLTKINDSHTADLYLNMSESDNDTICKAIAAVMARRDSILNRRMRIQNGDTLPSDSLPPVPYRRN